MPVYNGAKYLKETIDNVLLQTYRDFIFLIINDGSTDETEQIIISYTDPRIKYIKNQKNLGLVETLNKGIDLVETEFMARMDADDLWVETKSTRSDG
jgi:glycosyltransferase involved in cell wall biosynthesis